MGRGVGSRGTVGAVGMYMYSMQCPWIRCGTVRLLQSTATLACGIHVVVFAR